MITLDLDFNPPAWIDTVLNPVMGYGQLGAELPSIEALAQRAAFEVLKTCAANGKLTPTALAKLGASLYERIRVMPLTPADHLGVCVIGHHCATAVSTSAKDAMMAAFSGAMRYHATNQ